MGAREDTVTRMINLRRKVEPGLTDPDHWIGRDIWASPEWLIYSVLRGIALLERDGMAEADALRQVDKRLRLGVLPPGADVPSPAECLERLLRDRAPAYLAHRPTLLAKAVAAARKGLRKLPDAGWTTPNGCPPPDWRWERVPQPRARKMLDTFERRLRLVPQSVYDEELFDLVVRRRLGDQLWEWSSPSDTWHFMMGRGGIALVRNGRPIAEVVTLMN
jgi:hypothetical protein